MYKIGAVLEKGKAAVALYDGEYKLVSKKEGGEADLAALCLGVMADGGVPAARVAHVGLAVDGATGTPAAAAATLEGALGLACIGVPAVAARALGEAYAAGDAPSLVMVRIDETVECGIVIDRKLYPGAHQPAPDLAGMAVEAGADGCAGGFAAYVSRAGLLRLAAEAGVAETADLTPAALFAMDTPEAGVAQRRYVEYLACGITNLINLFQPKELVLDGPFTEAGEGLMAPFTEIVLREQYTHDLPNKSHISMAGDARATACLGAALLKR